MGMKNFADIPLTDLKPHELAEVLKELSSDPVESPPPPGEGVEGTPAARLAGHLAQPAQTGNRAMPAKMTVQDIAQKRSVDESACMKKENAGTALLHADTVGLQKRAVHDNPAGHCALTSAAHDNVLEAVLKGESIPLLSSMYFSRDCKTLLGEMRDPAKRKQVFQEMLARQAIDNELVAQICTTMLNNFEPDKLLKCFEGDNTIFRNILRTKHHCEAAIRAVIETDAKLNHAPHFGLTVKGTAVMNVAELQQVNACAAAPGPDSGVKTGTDPLRRRGRRLGCPTLKK